MKVARYILILVTALTVSLKGFAAGTSESKPGEAMNVTDFILDHVADHYSWHITSWGEKHISVPLPVIVNGNQGWNVFMSSHLSHGEKYRGLYIAEDGDYKGKIVEDINGVQKRPFDISITKNAFALLLNSLILIVLILSLSRWYKKNGTKAPGGFRGALEMLIMNLEDDIIKKCIGKDYRRYSPYLLTAFFFIFINNIMGLIPFFPGGANTTGNIAITLVLAVCTFFAINLFGNKEYWKEIFWPDVPMWLKVPIPIMPVIELFGVISKPFALMVRLFANIFAGHAIILGITCLIFVSYSMGVAIFSGMTVVSVIMSIFMNFIELLVAFLQAYVFTMLSAVFIGLSRVEHHAPAKSGEAEH